MTTTTYIINRLVCYWHAVAICYTQILHKGENFDLAIETFTSIMMRDCSYVSVKNLSYEICTYIASYVAQIATVISFCLSLHGSYKTELDLKVNFFVVV